MTPEASTRTTTSRPHVHNYRRALRPLAGSGAAALSLNAIARENGLSGPTLHWYFANRDALVTGDFDDVATRDAGRSAEERLRTVLGALRAWAISEPHLLFGADFRRPRGVPSLELQGTRRSTRRTARWARRSG
ncbi:TetR family transcriptional regulator [Cryptosporangium arvum]|uniref:TetR family transcriptional regulator n=1 Tax=Cryptosporangium arvum TaxID=80871 RepID=UPI000A0498A1